MPGVCDLVAAFFARLQQWQTLAAACVALLAAGIAFHNTTRSLRQAEQLETRRRERKRSALRSVLPFALDQLSHYAERSVHSLNELVSKCTDETLPSMTAPESLAQSPPSEALKILADFIEYSDMVDVAVIEGTSALIQIHDSRLRALVRDNRDPLGNHPVVRTQLEVSAVNAASIYAGAAAVYGYARRRDVQLPHSLTWDAVRAALNNMRIFENEYPRLHETVTRHENVTAGPFEPE